MFDDYTDLENNSKEQKIIWQELPDDGSVKHEKRSSGSRYADKQTGGAVKNRALKRTGQGRKRRIGWKKPLVCLAAVLAVLGIWMSVIVLLPMKKEDPGNVQEAGRDSSVSENAGDDMDKAVSKAETDDTAAMTESKDETEPEEKPKTEEVRENLIDPGILDSPYAVLMDAETGEFLAAERGDEKIFPASMTKMLTVLVAIEHIPNLDETIYMSEDYYQQLYDEDASRAGFEPGESAKIRDLLYGALLPSGAECCIELARRAAGTESAFVDLMNQKAADLGLVQTKFVNCTGLHNVEQFSTCAEIAKIVRAAIQNETFLTVFTTHRYSVDPSNIHPEGFTFWSTLFKSTVDEDVTGGEIIGGKTGFTEEAGRCLASLARIYDHLYILVTAGWSSDPEDEMYHINDAFRAYNALGSALEE